jgi:hypothetical protein
MEAEFGANPPKLWSSIESQALIFFGEIFEIKSFMNP